MHTNTIVIIVHTLMHINKSSTYEWKDLHLERHLVFGGGHHIQISHSKQLNFVVLSNLARPRRCCLLFLN